MQNVLENFKDRGEKVIKNHYSFYIILKLMFFTVICISQNVYAIFIIIIYLISTGKIPILHTYNFKNKNTEYNMYRK